MSKSINMKALDFILIKKFSYLFRLMKVELIAFSFLKEIEEY